MILRRLILGRLLSRTLFVLLTGILFDIVIDLMGNAPQLGRGSFLQIATLYLYRAPELAQQVLPLALVLGPLLALGGLAKGYELAAMKWSGGAMAQLLVPPMAGLAVGAALLAGMLSEWAVPFAAPRAVELQADVFALHGARYWSFYWPRRWMRTPQGFLRAGTMQGERLRDVVYVRTDAEQIPLSLVRAQELRAEGGRFVLYHGSLRDLVQAETPLQEFTVLDFPEPIEAGALRQHLGYPEIFTVGGLREAVAVHLAQGGPVEPFELALWRRLGDPLALLALVLVVTCFAAKARNGQPTERRLVEGALLAGGHVALRGLCGVLADDRAWRCALAALGPALLLSLLAAWLWPAMDHEALRPSLRGSAQGGAMRPAA